MSAMVTFWAEKVMISMDYERDGHISFQVLGL
jgi:hypothetical protein